MKKIVLFLLGIVFIPSVMWAIGVATYNIHIRYLGLGL